MNDGGLVATATNGAEPYSFQWTNGPGGASYGELTSGDYEVTATDANNCQATASGTVGINDLVNPEAIAKNIVVYLDDSGEASISGEMVDDGSYDNCELVSKSVSVSLVDCIHANAPVDVILTVADASGNTATANASVFVVDTIKPSLSLESIDLELNDEGVAYLSPNMLAPYVSDNCEVAQISIQTQVFSCESLQEGTTTQVLIFDNYGNSIFQTLQVNFVDTSDPEVEVRDVEIELNHDGFAMLTPEMLDIKEKDNCGIATRVLSKTQFSCEDLGSSVVDITVSDFAGNTSSASFNVTVLDKMAPQIIQPEPIEMCEGILEEVSIMVSDNCSAQLEQIDGPVSGYFITQGNYELTYLATDASGNEASVSVEIVVYANPLIDLGENFQVDGAATITLVGGNDANATYVWSTGETTSEITVDVTESVSIWVQVYSEMGCMEEDEIFIEMLNPLGVDVLDKGGIQVYPNPSSGYLNIVPAGIDNLNGAVVRIFDMNGKTVYEQKSATFVDGQPAALNISNLSKGVYILSLQTDNFSATQRIMKQ